MSIQYKLSFINSNFDYNWKLFHISNIFQKKKKNAITVKYLKHV